MSSTLSHLGRLRRGGTLRRCLRGLCRSLPDNLLVVVWEEAALPAGGAEAEAAPVVAMDHQLLRQ